MSSKLSLSILLVVAATCGFNPRSLNGQSDDNLAEDPQLFSLVLTLNDRSIAALKRTGFLKTRLPLGYRNRVASVVLKYPSSFLSNPMQVDENAQALSGTLTIKMGSSLIDRLEYQPVEMPIYQSNYSNVVVAISADGGDQYRNREYENSASPEFYVRLTPNNGVSGRFFDSTSISLETSFGRVDIQLDSVAGIRFNVDPAGSATVVMNNGDVVSGVPQADGISIATRWSADKIDLAKIWSITRDRRSKFVERKTEHGYRWVLDRAPRSSRTVSTR